jgi:hypothetical protein
MTSVYRGPGRGDHRPAREQRPFSLVERILCPELGLSYGSTATDRDRQVRHLRPPHSPRRQKDGLAGHAVDQTRPGHQPPDGQGDRPYCAADAHARADEVIE